MLRHSSNTLRRGSTDYTDYAEKKNLCNLRIVCRWGLALSALTLLALAVRGWQLNYHSLWFDEAMSVFWARKPAGEIIRVGLSLVLDKHPPLYYLLLHAWIRLFGDGPVAVRLPSVLLGALLPPALALLGQEVWGRRAGLIAGLLAALNPILVWYSQEARMFGPAAALGVLATLCLARALLRRDGRWWIGYVLCAWAGVYSYLFFALLLPFHALLALIWCLNLAKVGNLRKVEIAYLLAAFAAVGAGFAPLALQALRVGGAEAQAGRPFEGALSNLAALLSVYTLRQVPWPALWTSAATVAAALLLIAGVAAPPARGRWLLGVWLALPLLAGNLLLALDATVFAEVRYFLFLAPALCLAWGSALAWVGRRRPALGLALVGGWSLVALIALPHLWTPANRREDWRAAAQYVAAHAGPEDAILVHPAFVHVAFDYYYHGPAPVFYPFEGPVDAATDVDGPLNGLAGFSAVWLVTSHDAQPDPQGLVRGWLEARYPLITEQYPAGVTVRGYATHYRLAELPAGVERLDAAYAGGLRLAGYAADQRRLRAADDRYHPPSNWLHVTLYWQADAPLAGTFTAGVKLLDGLGQVWGAELARPNDALALWPAAEWPPGEIVRQDVDVNLNPATPAGGYRLELTVLDAGGRAWPLQRPAGGVAGLSLGEVQVTP